MTPQRTTFALLLATAVVLVLGRAIKGKAPSPAQIIALLFVGAGIGVMVEIAPGVAVPFAALAFITALLYAGTPVFENLTAQARRRGMRLVRVEGAR